MAKTIFRKGKVASKEGGSSQFMKISDGDAIVFAPLVGMEDMISVDQHEFWDINPAVIVPCIGRGCPACKIGNEAKFKAFLPVVDREGNVKIYAFGLSVERQLEALEEEVGSIKGRLIKVKRTGTGLKTKYTAIGLGKSTDVSDYELPDIISQLGPTEAPEVERLLIDNGLLDEEDAVAEVKVKGPAKKAPKPIVEEDDADEEEDVKKPVAKKGKPAPAAKAPASREEKIRGAKAKSKAEEPEDDEDSTTEEEDGDWDEV